MSYPERREPSDHEEGLHGGYSRLMPSPQRGIFIEGATSHWFQQYDVALSAGEASIRSALAKTIDELSSAKEPSGQDVELVVGFGPNLADRLGVDVPADFRAFETIGTGARSAPATQHDLWIWIHGDDRGALFDSALRARRALTEVAAIVGDVPCFVYKDNRDLTGFIDGTENPETEEGSVLAVVGQGLPGAGGSTVLVQRWDHDLDAFHALSESDQENIIGRTKLDSVELDESVLPDTAHIARVVMEDHDGKEIEVYRRSVPWGDSTEAGLMFVAFTNELAKVDNMVRAMFGPIGADEDAEVYDRLTDFSNARSSSYFFVPNEDVLAGITAGSRE